MSAIAIAIPTRNSINQRRKPPGIKQWKFHVLHSYDDGIEDHPLRREATSIRIPASVRGKRSASIAANERPSFAAHITGIHMGRKNKSTHPSTSAIRFAVTSSSRTGKSFISFHNSNRLGLTDWLTACLTDGTSVRCRWCPFALRWSLVGVARE